MLAPENNIIATIMLLGTMTCWGSWSSIRMLCKADGPVFVILYILGQFVVGIVCEFSFGMGTGIPGLFNSQTFLGGWMKQMAWYRILAIVIGGSCCANSDFLASCACTRLPFAVVVPIFMGWALIQATVLNYIIEDSDANPYYLFAGVFMAFMAICSMSLSDRYAVTESSEYSTRISQGSFGKEKSTDRDVLQARLLHSADSDIDDAMASLPAIRGQTKTNTINSWIYVSVFAGAIAGMWSPLQVMGRKGTGAVDNPLVCLFLFHSGAVLSIPMMLFYHGRVIATAGKVSGGASEVEYMSDYWQQLLDLPMKDKMFGMLAGGVVAMGTFLFFTASAVLSSTISFAICSCAPLVSIAIGVIIFKQLDKAPTPQTVFIALASVLFTTAIVLMVLADMLVN